MLTLYTGASNDYDRNYKLSFEGLQAMNAPAPLPTSYGVTPMPKVMSMRGIDFIRAMFAGELPAPPIMQTMGIGASSAEVGRVEFRATPSINHYNPIGSVHGGYAATLLDSAMGCAIHTALPPGVGYTTLEFKVNFIRGMSVDTGEVRAIGTVINVGRRAAVAEAKIVDAQDRLIAHATTTCLVFETPVK